MLSPIRLGRTGQLQVRVDPSLILGLAYLAWSLEDRYATLAKVAEVMPFRMLVGPVAWAALVATGAFASVLVHEAAHICAVRVAGGRVRSLTLSLVAGRMHVEWRGGLYRNAHWLAALAGPAMSGLLGVAFAFASSLVGQARADVHLACYDLSRLNLIYAAVQLTPATPFDGGRLLRGLLMRRLGVVGSSALVARLGKTLAVATAGAAIALAKLPLLFIAVFLYASAEADTDDEAIAARLRGLSAHQVVTPAPCVARRDMSCGELAAQMARLGVDAVPVVTSDGLLVSTVSAADLRRVPAWRQWMTRIGDLTHTGRFVSSDTDLELVRRYLRRRRLRAVAVAQGRDLLGIVTLEAIHRRVELEDLAHDEAACWVESPSDAPSSLPV